MNPDETIVEYFNRHINQAVTIDGVDWREQPNRSEMSFLGAFLVTIASIDGHYDFEDDEYMFLAMQKVLTQYHEETEQELKRRLANGGRFTENDRACQLAYATLDKLFVNANILVTAETELSFEKVICESQPYEENISANWAAHMTTAAKWQRYKATT